MTDILKGGILALYQDHPDYFQYVFGGFYQAYKEKLEGSTLDDNFISRWLYEDNWTEEKLSTFEKLYGTKLGKMYFDYLLDRRADNEYLKRYGLTYSDIHDPRKLRQVGSASHMYGYAMNFVSDNVKRLYR